MLGLLLCSGTTNRQLVSAIYGSSSWPYSHRATQPICSLRKFIELLSIPLTLHIHAHELAKKSSDLFRHGDAQSNVCAGRVEAVEGSRSNSMSDSCSWRLGRWLVGNAALQTQDSQKKLQRCEPSALNKAATRLCRSALPQ